jgi:transcriptional regulator with XRE-family HTH domain
MAIESRTTTYTAIIGWVLRQAREEAGMTQAVVAEELGVGPSAWAKIEKGYVPINVTQLAKVARLLGREPHEIVERADAFARHWQDTGKTLGHDSVPQGASPKAFLLGAALGGALTALLIRAAAKPTSD